MKNFFATPLYLGRLFGIPIRAHYSWLPVFPFYAWAIASSLLPRQAPGLTASEYWLLGFITTFLLFLSVLFHELAHSLMARAEGLGTGSITLYIFGGLASLEGQPANPSAEFKIALVGPAANFVMGTIFFLTAQSLSKGAAEQVFRHLGLVNWFLAVFNILPGMPLDGGRVLRAIVWRFNKNFRAATQIANRAGLVIAVTLVVYGLYFFAVADKVIGLSSVSLGVMIGLMLGTAEGRNYGLWRVKRGTVEDVMNRDVVLISPQMKVADFIDKVLQNNRDTSFPVAEDQRLHGMLLLEDLKALPREEWAKTQAKDCMRPVDNSMFISARLTVPQAQTMLANHPAHRAVVIDANGLIIGHVSLNDLRKAQNGNASTKN
ncbi:MAG: site-2 protease family protein [Acidobacteria bacterium]|nr:site-2 protease family protein [Acidobacteriota bacterium]